MTNTNSLAAGEHPVHVYLIDVCKQCVTEVFYNGTLAHLYELLNCRLIDLTARQPNRDGIYCADELPDEPELTAFRLRSTGQVIYGNGLWVGCDDEGETVGPVTPFERVRKEIEFLGLIPYQLPPIMVWSW